MTLPDVNARTNLGECAEEALVLRSRPTRAWLSVTGKCNLLCTHCPRSLVDEQYLSSDEMPPAVFDRVEHEIFPTLQLLRVGGNNLGEQLFARSWNQYAQRIRAQPFTPWLITNAQTLNDARIGELVHAGYIIDVSIDGASEAKYREIRGASLSKLTEHVRTMVRAREAWDGTAPAGSRRAKIIFSFTAFADNIDELPALVRLALDLGVDEVVVTHYMPSLEEQRYQSLFYHQSAANRAFAEARALAADSRLSLLLPPDYPIRSLGQVDALRVRVKDRYGRELGKSGATRSPKCHHPWTSVSINEKGEVYPCCQSNLLMGDLKKSSFDEIWNNRRYQQLRKTVNSDTPMHDCRRCVLRGESFTSVDCDEGSFFLRNLDLPAWTQGGWHARLRDRFARSAIGRWLWQAGRSAYKNFLEWHLVPR